MIQRTKIGITGFKGVLGREFITKFKDKCEFYIFRGDITNYNQVSRWIKKLKKNNVRKIFHFAAKVKLKQKEDKKEFINVNKIGTDNLLKNISLIYIDYPWIFIASTCQVYKSQNKPLSETDDLNPINDYSKSKFETEKICKKFKSLNKKMCIGRIFSYTSILQKDNFFIPSIYKKLKNEKKTVDVYGSNKIRDFLYATDIVDIISKLSVKEFFGIINIASGSPVSIKQVAVYIKNKINSSSKLIFYNDNSERFYFSNNKKLNDIIAIKINYKSVMNKYIKSNN